MKKLIAAIFAVVLMSVGLVGLSGSSATAACPYTSCIATKTSVSAPATVKLGKSPKVSASVKVNGSAKPVGKLTITIKGPGYSSSKTFSYSGGTKSFTGAKVKKPGKYKVTAKFTPKGGSVFKGSAGSDSFTVKRQS